MTCGLASFLLWVGWLWIHCPLMRQPEQGAQGKESGMLPLRQRQSPRPGWDVGDAAGPGQASGVVDGARGQDHSWCCGNCQPEMDPGQKSVLLTPDRPFAGGQADSFADCRGRIEW